MFTKLSLLEAWLKDIDSLTLEITNHLQVGVAKLSHKVDRLFLKVEDLNDGTSPLKRLFDKNLPYMHDNKWKKFNVHNDKYMDR